MRVSIRRTLRVGEQAGTPVENLGVTPDERYFMTKNDLLNSNEDLINHATEILSKLPVRHLDIRTEPSVAGLTVTATTSGLSRLDVYIDGRPVQSFDIDGQPLTFQVDVPADAELLECAGYDKDSLVVARKIRI